MKANVIFAAIAMSMISAVAFGQVEQEAAKAVGSAEAAITGTTEAVAPTAAGTAAALVKGGQGTAAQMLDTAQQVTAKALLPAQSNEQDETVGLTCDQGSGATTLEGANLSDWNADVAEGYAKERCMDLKGEKTEPKTALIVLDISNAARAATDNTPYAQTTPEQQLASGEAVETEIAQKLGITKKAAANKIVCLGEHQNQNNQVDACYLPDNWFAHSGLPAAAREGVTLQNADCSL